MKKVLSFMLVIAMLLTQLALPVFADAAGDGWFEPDYVDPYEGLVVKDITVDVQKTLIKDIDGWYETNEAGKDEYFYYNLYDADAIVTVEYENGEEEVAGLYDLYAGVYLDENQYEEPWGLGTHTVTGSYRGFEFSFDVEVVETPVASVSAKPQYVLVDGWDSHEHTVTDENGNETTVKYYYEGRTEPVFTITMKDGTVYSGDEFEITEQTEYYPHYGNDQENNPYEIGKNTVNGSFMGFDFTFEIEVIANPYKSVSLKGENELYLVFEGIDEKDSYEDKVTYISFNDWSEDYSYIDAYIETESGEYYYVSIYGDVRDGFIPNKNIKFVFEGGMQTNTLETCNFLVVEYIADEALYVATEYYQVDEMITGKQFAGYNADDEADVDHIVALATMMNGEMHWEGDLAYSDTVENTEKSIEYLFGRTDIDVRDSALYNFSLFGSTVEIAYYGYSSYTFTNESLVFGDGKWTVTADVYDYETYEYIGAITLVLNVDGTIYSIDMEEIGIEAGDVNCDGEVTAVDARVILQYVAGLIDEYDFYAFYADVNNDGEITALDARVILQQVAGLIK